MPREDRDPLRHDWSRAPMANYDCHTNFFRSLSWGTKRALDEGDRPLTSKPCHGSFVYHLAKCAIHFVGLPRGVGFIVLALEQQEWGLSGADA